MMLVEPVCGRQVQAPGGDTVEETDGPGHVIRSADVPVAPKERSSWRESQLMQSSSSKMGALDARSAANQERPVLPIRWAPTRPLDFANPNGGPQMMDQRNLIIAGAAVVAAILAYYYFTTITPAPKKEGVSQYNYYAIPAPAKFTAKMTG